MFDETAMLNRAELLRVEEALKTGYRHIDCALVRRARTNMRELILITTLGV